MKTWFITLVAALVAGCGQFGAVDISAESSALAGLDGAVVAEVLANPIARQRINEEPEATRESMAQGIVRNFIVCRSAHDAYRTWIGTGIAPEPPPLPEPTNPIDPSAGNWVAVHASLVDSIQSGEPDRLRSWITGNGSCGVWIPAIAGQPDGLTINDAIESGA